ncbi:hypothetical protein [Comamonas thiooxydans]|uniref:hypothetical protein n=1 Tax=Comamonas thiooxydans TaxID=363952 RepID=UPI001CCC48D1|nr:hypothetical protein [Comamonas thiooxydans]UBQ43342.1 hypothetical protein LCH15_07675 [Comamonas thiooxydans]
MPAPKPLPKPQVVAKRHDALFESHDKLKNNRDSRALGMLAEVLSVITKITSNPPSTQLDEFHAWDLLTADRPPHSKKYQQPPRLKKWEQDLMYSFNRISFNEIRSIFPSNPNLIGEGKYKAHHAIHPRLKEWEKFKNRFPNIFDGFSTGSIEDRIKLHSLVENIIKDARSKEGRLAYEQHIRHVTNSKESAKKFVDEILEKHKSLQVTRLILMFKNSENKQYLDYEIVRNYWDEFKFLLGKIDCAYIGKLSHSTIRSYYFHLILFFPENATADSILSSLIENKILPNNFQKPLDQTISGVINEIWKTASTTKNKIKINTDIKFSEYEKYSIKFTENNNLQSKVLAINKNDKKSLKTLIEEIINPIFEMDLYARLIPPKESNDSKQGDRTYWKGGKDRLQKISPISKAKATA